jgi:crossover junction endodeoxyribonuclease RuvC
VRVLGVDPGSRFLGYGFVEERLGAATYLAHGVVKTDPRAPLSERLHTLFVELGRAMTLFKPEAVAVEGVFTHKNARSALILGQARGVVLLLAAQHGLLVHEYAPARVQRSVGAGGNNGKGAVARMVSLQLKLPGKLERADAYDALAVALCHVAMQKPVLRALNVGARGSADFKDRLSAAYVAPLAAGTAR